MSCLFLSDLSTGAIKVFGANGIEFILYDGDQLVKSLEVKDDAIPVTFITFINQSKIYRQQIPGRDCACLVVCLRSLTSYAPFLKAWRAQSRSMTTRIHIFSRFSRIRQSR